MSYKEQTTTEMSHEWMEGTHTALPIRRSWLHIMGRCRWVNVPNKFRLVLATLFP